MKIATWWLRWEARQNFAAKFWDLPTCQQHAPSPRVETVTNIVKIIISAGVLSWTASIFFLARIRIEIPTLAEKNTSSPIQIQLLFKRQIRGTQPQLFSKLFPKWLQFSYSLRSGKKGLITFLPEVSIIAHFWLSHTCRDPVPMAEKSICFLIIWDSPSWYWCTV